MRMNRTGWLFVGEGALIAARIISLIHSSGGRYCLYLLMLLLPLINVSRGVMTTVLYTPQPVSYVTDQVFDFQLRTLIDMCDYFGYPLMSEEGIFLRNIGGNILPLLLGLG